VKLTEAKIAFAGTPEFADTILQTLLQGGIRPCTVYTQPDRPRGRGRKVTSSAVKSTALAHQLSVQQPHQLSSPESIQALILCQPDLLIVAAYGLILPQQVLDLPRLGCVNVHASLLPRWRGAAPIARAIENGDDTTGITLMQMARGLDNGDILHQEQLNIGPRETTATLQKRLAHLGAQTLFEYLPTLLSNRCQSQRQDATLTCYANKLSKEEAQIDWRLSAVQLDRQIRAFNPFPIARAVHHNQTIRIWQAQPEPSRPDGGSTEPGKIMAIDRTGIVVGCGVGALRLLELQRAGGKRLSAANFLNGYRLSVGDPLQATLP